MVKRIITAWAESASGPGWANQLVWYIISDEEGKLTPKCLQPDEQSAEIIWLYRISEATHKAMTAAVETKLNKRNRRKRKSHATS